MIFNTRNVLINIIVFAVIILLKQHYVGVQQDLLSVITWSFGLAIFSTLTSVGLIELIDSYKKK